MRGMEMNVSTIEEFVEVFIGHLNEGPIRSYIQETLLANTASIPDLVKACYLVLGYLQLEQVFDNNLKGEVTFEPRISQKVVAKPDWPTYCGFYFNLEIRGLSEYPRMWLLISAEEADSILRPEEGGVELTLYSEYRHNLPDKNILVKMGGDH